MSLAVGGLLFWHLWQDDYRAIVDRYIGMLEIEGLREQDPVLVQVLRFLGVPTEPRGERLWQGITQDSWATLQGNGDMLLPLLTGF